MKSKRLVSVIVALAIALSSGGLVFARGPNDHNDRWKEKPMQHGAQQDRRGSNERQSNYRDDWRQRNDNHRWDERGAGPNHNFRRGQRLPVEYRHRQYVIEDWRGYRLSAPPRGYHWVQTGGDYVLVAIASGIILQLILSN